ncbi:MAG: tripartite tricarboxylate transporter substrate binding protein [Armatimonadota bacterium]|nr:tripartite tricarboxylate transporter substrate binding protein [Armatimonadota bacterium]MDR7451065.1 tripartite tricarboxylate transporter substrate binding protein [Armatimonadota bacterium]MDR7465914.1 tripartite tricarboxylate transporter substrate binding protein [Armatimonadota bacterium]MDR7493979.1 tripartite tricarboxylate transporter substrate binding protein [Armatimonadota bacterium]MDR7498429.1 tripartite tricarboxylate transporter substrate binding protein [Armatimonadota bact
MERARPSEALRVSVVVLLGVALALGLAAVPSTAQAYPERNIIGIIQWGAGGTTDRVSRKVAPLADRLLGQRIVLNNMTGASGATGMQYVYDQPADGYTLLFAAENPTLYGILDISPRNFDEFIPINLFARSIPVIVVRSDSKYRYLDDLIRDARQRPGQIKAGGTGIGGVPFVVGAMMTAVSGVKFNTIPFDGDGPALAALLGGHIDFHVSVLSAAAEHMRAGRMRAIAVVDNVPNFGAPGVPALGQMIPQYRSYLPWGPFFGVWVKKGTPAPAVAKLTEAFKAAVGSEEFKEFAELLGAVPLNLSGDEAMRFVKQWQSVTAWLLYDAGAAKKSPQAFGIPRPSR